MLILDVPRPSNSTLTQGRVKPSDLQDYRQSHRMLGPCCLCPMQDATQPDFVEAAMYMITVGLLSGEYVASCARNRCGYFGEPLPLSIDKSRR